MQAIYIRNKPTKWVLKLWVLADSSNGYTWHFQVYHGKERESVSLNGLSYDVVMKIVSGLEKQGYIVYMDNYYSSPTLFKELVKQEFGAVGTQDTTRKGCPFVLRAQKKMMKTGNKRGYGVSI